jgi:two-component system, cell cycle sensor histidine kinase and response regulator CckA
MTGSTQYTPKLLLVDDTPSALEALSVSFEGQGYQITTATNGPEALELARSLDPDLILLDVMMPGMSGFEVCRALREDPALAEVPVIFVTALDDRQSLIEGIESGADDFISKPPNRTELRARVRTITRLDRHRRLALERERLESVFQLSPDGILVLDRTATIRMANPAARRLLGGAEDFELEGQDLSKLVAPHVLDFCRSSLSEVLNGSKDRILVEFDCVTQAGAGFPTEVAAGPFPLEDGIGVEIIIRDVSERKRLEEEVQRSQRLDAIGRVSAGIAHDFNNVLQVILLSAELALANAPKEGVLLYYLEEIMGATREGTALAKQLLTFARRESVARRLVDLNGVIKEIEPIARTLGGKGLQFSLDLSDEALPVQADSGQLKQIITNLVVNARDALPDGGSLTVSTVSRGTEVELSVADNGHGMDEEILDRIFEPFFSTKDSDEGTGLGLSVVRGIVEGHQGTISVESVVGEGTTFRVRLPLGSPGPES